MRTQALLEMQKRVDEMVKGRLFWCNAYHLGFAWLNQSKLSRVVPLLTKRESLIDSEFGWYHENSSLFGAGFYFWMKQASESVSEKKIKKGWLFIQRV